MKMSCPTSQIQSQASSPPSVCCSPYGMTVKVHGLSAAEVLRANGKHNNSIDSNDVNCFSLFKINDFVATVRGEWTPLVVLAEQCGYSLDSHGADVVFAAPFITCGITVKVNFRKDPVHGILEAKFFPMAQLSASFFFFRDLSL